MGSPFSNELHKHKPGNCHLHVYPYEQIDVSLKLVQIVCRLGFECVSVFMRACLFTYAPTTMICMKMVTVCLCVHIRVDLHICLYRPLACIRIQLCIDGCLNLCQYVWIYFCQCLRLCDLRCLESLDLEMILIQRSETAYLRYNLFNKIMWLDCLYGAWNWICAEVPVLLNYWPWNTWDTGTRTVQTTLLV